MSRNNKNARLQKLEEALPKNRSASAKERRAAGQVRQPGRATAPKHAKKNAWWQVRLQGGSKQTYREYIKGGGKVKRGKSVNEEAGEVTTEVDA